MPLPSLANKLKTTKRAIGCRNNTSCQQPSSGHRVLACSVVLHSVLAHVAASVGSTCGRGSRATCNASGQSRQQLLDEVLSMDPDGFDAAADTVGAGIYSGRVKRDENGNVIIGRQYQNHNPEPGPVYAGGGFTDMAKAIHAGPEAVRKLLDGGADPNEIMTGGARPLHTCGMSRRGQMSTQLLIDAGAEIEAVDTYGYTPLHRMASNNLPVGAEALLKAGADPNRRTVRPYRGDTPLGIAQHSGAHDVVEVLLRYGAEYA